MACTLPNSLSDMVLSYSLADPDVWIRASNQVDPIMNIFWYILMILLI